jgi:transcription elongation factor Elf1
MIEHRLEIFTKYSTTCGHLPASDVLRGVEMKTLPENHTHGLAHCPMCTHTVPAQIDLKGKHARVAAGQKCPRCGSSLEVAVVIHIPEAA